MEGSRKEDMDQKRYDIQHSGRGKGEEGDSCRKMGRTGNVGLSAGYELSQLS